MARSKFFNVSLNEELKVLIDNYIKTKKRGYKSRAELVSDSVRRLIDDV